MCTFLTAFLPHAQNKSHILRSCPCLGIAMTVLPASMSSLVLFERKVLEVNRSVLEMLPANPSNVGN